MSLSVCSPYSTGAFLCSLPSLPSGCSGVLLPSCLHQGKKHQKRGKIGQNLYFIWCALVFSRGFRRPKGAKSKHIFESKEGMQGVEVVGCLPSGVPTGCRWSGNSCYFADVSKIGQDPAGCSAFCPLSRFALGALLANMALFCVLRAFSEGFGVLA